VVNEAATEVIARGQAAGVAEPWQQVGFCDDIVALQRERQESAAGAIQVFDRSPLCTLALARFLEHPVSPGLAAEVARVVADQVYEPTVFLVRPLGFIVATEARRISYPDSLAFEAVHEQVYREYGFVLVDVPPADVGTRAAFVESRIAG
jgi:predicted ATPase